MEAKKDETPEELFRQRMEKFRWEPFKSSLQYWLDHGKITGTLLVEVQEMLNDYAGGHVSKALASAADQVKIKHVPPTMTNMEGVEIQKDSILNSYKIQH